MAADVNGVPSFVFTAKPVVTAIRRMYGLAAPRPIVHPMGVRAYNALRLARQRADRKRGIR